MEKIKYLSKTEPVHKIDKYTQEDNVYISCVCGYYGNKNNWDFITKVGENKVISCPECGTLKHLTNHTIHWKNHKKD